MSIAERAPAGLAQPTAKGAGTIGAGWGLGLAIAVLVAILLMPTPAGLPIAGHRMLAIFGFAVVVWVSEALEYAISAAVVAALMALLLGTAPSLTNPKVLIGTASALT